MDALTSNLLAWMAQTTLLATAGAVLPLLFRRDIRARNSPTVMPCWRCVCYCRFFSLGGIGRRSKKAAPKSRSY